MKTHCIVHNWLPFFGRKQHADDLDSGIAPAGALAHVPSRHLPAALSRLASRQVPGRTTRQCRHSIGKATQHEQALQLTQWHWAPLITHCIVRKWQASRPKTGCCEWWVAVACRRNTHGLQRSLPPMSGNHTALSGIFLFWLAWCFGDILIFTVFVVFVRWTLTVMHAVRQQQQMRTC